MKINRIINGQNVEIELTPAEMVAAYDEKQHDYDKMDIQDLYDWLPPEEIESTYGITKDALDAGLDKMADAMRRDIDKYGTSWDYARDCAFEDFLAKHAC